MSGRAKESSDSVDRDQQILSRLARIEHKVDSLDQTTAFALRAESEKHQASVLAVFGARVRRAQVYLAANGSRNVRGIAVHLRMKPQNVSRELVVLKDEGLLELADSNTGGDIYAKKAVDRTLRITPFLCTRYSLQRDGSSAEGGKGRRLKPKAKTRRK